MIEPGVRAGFLFVEQVLASSTQKAAPEPPARPFSFAGTAPFPPAAPAAGRLATDCRRANFLFVFQYLIDGIPQLVQVPGGTKGTTSCQGNYLKKYSAPQAIFVSTGKGFESKRFCPVGFENGGLNRALQQSDSLKNS